MQQRAPVNGVSASLSVAAVFSSAVLFALSYNLYAKVSDMNSNEAHRQSAIIMSTLSNKRLSTSILLTARSPTYCQRNGGKDYWAHDYCAWAPEVSSCSAGASPTKCRAEGQNRSVEDLMYPEAKVELPTFAESSDTGHYIVSLGSGAVPYWRLDGKEGRPVLHSTKGRLVYLTSPAGYLYRVAEDIPAGACDMQMWKQAVVEAREAPRGARVFDNALLVRGAARARDLLRFAELATREVVQAEHALVAGMTVLIAGHADVAQDADRQASWWRFNQTKVVYLSGGAPQFAKRLLLSCDTPMTHPYLVLRARHLLLGPDVKTQPLEERRVLVVQRGGGDGGGLDHDSERQVVMALSRLAVRRARGERVAVVDLGGATRTNATAQLQLARWVYDNARVVVGPALWAHRFAAAATLVVEMSRDVGAGPHLECAAALDLQWFMLRTPLGDRPDTRALLRALSQRLSAASRPTLEGATAGGSGAAETEFGLEGVKGWGKTQAAAAARRWAQKHWGAAAAAG